MFRLAVSIAAISANCVRKPIRNGKGLAKRKPGQSRDNKTMTKEVKSTTYIFFGNGDFPTGEFEKKDIKSVQCDSANGSLLYTFTVLTYSGNSDKTFIYYDETERDECYQLFTEMMVDGWYPNISAEDAYII